MNTGKPRSQKLEVHGSCGVDGILSAGFTNVGAAFDANVDRRPVSYLLSLSMTAV